VTATKPTRLYDAAHKMRKDRLLWRVAPSVSARQNEYAGFTPTVTVRPGAEGARLNRLWGYPSPVTNFRHILTIRVDISLVLDKLRFKQPFQLAACIASMRQPVDRVHNKVEAIKLGQHCHVKCGGDGAILLIATHVQIGVVGTSIREAVNQVWIAVKGEYGRLVLGEERVEIAVTQSVRVRAFRLQLHQVDDIDHPNF